MELSIAYIKKLADTSHNKTSDTVKEKLEKEYSYPAAVGFGIFIGIVEGSIGKFIVVLLELGDNDTFYFVAGFSCITVFLFYNKYIRYKFRKHIK